MHMNLYVDQHVLEGLLCIWYVYLESLHIYLNSITTMNLH